MKLFYAATSPFVRKCLVSAHELGLRDRLELLPAAAHPVNRDRTVVARNPLGKVPTLITEEGTALYDSRVICEYLNAWRDRCPNAAVWFEQFGRRDSMASTQPPAA